MTEQQRIDALIPAVIAWHRENRRSWPWREDPTPYHVWISEIMLQQTRIEAAIPYYRRFLAALPDVAALANVEDDALMKLWEGLGYYSRARNLKKAAQRVMNDYGGELPRTAGELRSLAGIGDYTAGAISSIACGEGEPAVDGNVLRVVMRVLRSDEDILKQKTKQRVTELLRASYPTGLDARLMTEGIMELGQTLCIPNGEARCGECPLRELCLACESGDVENYPVKAEKKARRVEQKTVLLLHRGECYAIAKRPDRGLLAGLWELPNMEGHLSAAEVKTALEGKGLSTLSVESCGSARHIFTHVEWDMVGYRVACEAPSETYLWQSAEEIRAAYPIPTAFKAYTKQL